MAVNHVQLILFKGATNQGLIGTSNSINPGSNISSIVNITDGIVPLGQFSEFAIEGGQLVQLVGSDLSAKTFLALIVS